MKIDIWSDIACPWCYIGKRRFERALADFEHSDEVEVTWRSYQLDPTLPERYEGTSASYLAGRKGFPAAQVEQMQAHVAAQAAAEGLSYDFGNQVVANSLRGHQLLHLAKEHGVGDQVKESLLSAHFESGGDIGDVELLVRLGTEAGLDEREIRDELASGSRVDAVRADIQQAARIGVQGVPYFVIDGTYGVSGAQQPEAFIQVLERAWQEAHPIQVLAQGDECGPDGCRV